MPYCCQCGKPTQPANLYCAHCGVAQGPAGQAPAGGVSGISPRTASLLCYLPLVGWIPAIVVLASAKFRHDLTVRFHAFQGIYLYVAWLLVDWVLGPFFGFRFLPRFHVGGPPHQFFLVGILKVVIFIAWIVMLIKTSRGEVHKLPLVGELAERSVSEQK